MHLTHADLVKSGLKLNKWEAQSLHAHITRIAQHGSDDAEEVYTPIDDEEAPSTFEWPETEAPEDTEPEIEHTITQEDLDNNPELVDEGVSIGDEVSFSAETDSEDADDSEQPAEEKAKRKYSRKAKSESEITE